MKVFSRMTKYLVVVIAMFIALGLFSKASIYTATASQGVLRSISILSSQVNITSTCSPGQALIVQAQYVDGTTEIITSYVSFTSSNANVASVTNGVVVSGGTVGTAVITASYQGMQSYAVVTVLATQKVLQSISFSPSTVNISGMNTSGQVLTVQAQYSDGTTGIITSGVNFTSSNASVAYVTNGTVFSGGTTGTAVITGSYQGMQGFATVNVSNSYSTTPNSPTASVPSGVLSQSANVMLMADSGSVIRYTIDNSEPNAYSMIYTTPILVSGTMTIKAKAFIGSMSSPTFTAVYVVDQSNNIGDMLSRAKALYNSKKYDDAIALLNNLLIISKDNQDAVILLADCYIQKSDLNNAKSRLIQFINVYEYPRVINKYAQVCIELGQYEEARQKLTNILPRYENEIYLYSTLVRAYENLGVTGIRVLAHGTEIDFSNYDNVNPMLSSGRTIIPIRALSESLGATVSWVSDSTAIIQLGDKKIEVTKDSKNAKINGVNYVMDTPALIVRDRLMVPLRFISENFGYQVNWYSIESMVNIISITNNN